MISLWAIGCSVYRTPLIIHRSKSWPKISCYGPPLGLVHLWFSSPRLLLPRGFGVWLVLRSLFYWGNWYWDAGVEDAIADTVCADWAIGSSQKFRHGVVFPSGRCLGLFQCSSMYPKFCPLNTSFHFWLTSVVLTVQGDSFDLNGKGHSVFFQGSTGLVYALWGSESTCSPVRRSSETVVTFPCGVSEHLPPCFSRWACAHWDHAQMSAHHSFFLRIFGTLLPLEQPSTLSLGIPYLTATRVFIPNLFFIVSLFRPLPKLGWLLRLHIDDSLFLPFPLLNFSWLFRAHDSTLLVRLPRGTWIALLRC